MTVILSVSEGSFYQILRRRLRSAQNDRLYVALYEDGDCVVYKCVDCETVYIPPEMQDKFILDEDVYFSVLALQRAYTVNLIAGNLKQAEATMRIIDNIRSSYNGGAGPQYDFKDKDGAYVSNYKYQFDSYDDFYVEVSITENTDALIVNLTLEALGRAIQEISDTVIDVEEVSKDVELLYNNLTSLLSAMYEGKTYTFNEAIEVIWNLMVEDLEDFYFEPIDEFLLDLLKSAGLKVNFVKYTIAGVKAAWELCKLVPDLMQLPSNNYMVNIEYGSENSGWSFSGKYYYENMSKVYGEDGVEPTVDILHNSFGKFRFVYGAGTPSDDWYDIVGSMS